ncbi:MAG: hypothetical protein IJH04_03455 [Eggerthellaceae bacterium]|nr:hypothetical protein [Eggerthellaceae bacterium]
MALVHDLRDIINLAHARAWDAAIKHGKSSPDEPGIVSQLVRSTTCQDMTAAVAKWPAALGNTYATLSGSFIHQSPKVEFNFNGMRRTTEIGDLLLIAIDHANQSGTATLLQAKKSAQRSTGALAGGNADAQFHLYEQWPQFISANSTFPQHSPRTKSDWDLLVQPDTGSYLTVYDDHAYQVPPLAGSWAPQRGPRHAAFQTTFDCSVQRDDASMTFGSPLAAGASITTGVDCPSLLGDFMQALLLGRQGRPFQLLTLPNAIFTDWDHFIDEMLRLGAKASYTFNHAASGAKNQPRHRVLALCNDFPAQALAATTLFDPRSAEAIRTIAKAIWGKTDFHSYMKWRDWLHEWPVFDAPLPTPGVPDFIPPPGEADRGPEGGGLGMLVFHLFGMDGEQARPRPEWDGGIRR